jgi:hypothetical protein
MAPAGQALSRYMKEIASHRRRLRRAAIVNLSINVVVFGSTPGKAVAAPRCMRYIAN